MMPKRVCVRVGGGGGSASILMCPSYKHMLRLRRVVDFFYLPCKNPKAFVTFGFQKNKHTRGRGHMKY